MKLQILVPQYKETDDIIKPLLDSIEVQQNVDLKNDVGVIIVNDGTDVHLSQELLSRYTYPIEYYLNEHKGVSATRNACLDRATADYVMFCDADDLFCSAFGLFLVFSRIDAGGFDTLVSDFIEEVKDKATGKFQYMTHQADCTFVHGKIHNRQYLLRNNIRWDDRLTLHEDGYFNTLCQKLARTTVRCSTPFYLWKWRDNSVCRGNSEWVLKTYEHYILGSEALVEALLQRGKTQAAQDCVTAAVLRTYFTMSTPDWVNQKDQQHRVQTENLMRDFYLKFKALYESTPEETKVKTVKPLKDAMYGQGLMWEVVTFEGWLKQLGVGD